MQVYICGLCKHFLAVCSPQITPTGPNMTDTTASAGLYARTLHLAKNAPRHIKQGHMAAHLGVSDAWISRFVNGKMPNPGVVECQKLHDYLEALNVGTN